jgi:hypothetical protein
VIAAKLAQSVLIGARRQSDSALREAFGVAHDLLGNPIRLTSARRGSPFQARVIAALWLSLSSQFETGPALVPGAQVGANKRTK